MQINKELILRVAKNARLSLNDEEINKFIEDFKEILKSFSAINNVNTDNVKPSFQPINIKNSLREDSPKECVSQEEILKNAKHKKGDYFLGPKAL